LFIKKDTRNIGIFAHVDAGKTTLTENLLFITGGIKKMGRVDDGTAHTDSMDIERERGISVQAAAASIRWKDTTINIIDTPGHVDFSAEVERAMLALDGAILVISAMEGVQSQTELIWRGLEDMKIPTIIFINKIDRSGADVEAVMKQIIAMTNNKAVPLQKVIGLEKDARVVELKSMDSEETEKLCEALAEYSDSFLESLLEERPISNDDIEECVAELSRDFRVCPVLYGAALKGLGVEAVLDGIIKYLPAPCIEGGDEPVGIVYKIHHGRVGGKAAYVRFYEGFTEVKKYIYNSTKDIEEKVNMIFKVKGSSYEPAGYLQAGDIGIIYGLNSARVGDIIGRPKATRKYHKLASPTLAVRVHASRLERLEDLVEAFKILEEEDPLLNVQWKENERELHVHLMGIVHMQILTEIVKSRFKLNAIFEKPTVVYKETPEAEAVGYVEMYTPNYATLELKIEPLPRGSGLIYESAFSTDYIFQKYQKEVEQTVPIALREGLMGYEVTDIKVTLIGGKSTKLATQPSDFRAVTPIAIMKALKEAGTKLLEPIQEYEINISKDEAGIVMKHLMTMRASMEEQIIIGDRFIIKGIVPVATSMDYSVTVASFSQGRSSYKTRFLGYRECLKEHEVVS
jgi:ribosomal protection tetracycline resistance protein